jgi:hypothetical protein
MQPDVVTLANLLSVALLLTVTIEYIEIVRRRVQLRQVAAEREEGAEIGLRGLVRVLLVNETE